VRFCAFPPRQNKEIERADDSEGTSAALVLLAVLAGAEAFTDIARFGERKIERLRGFDPM
jgi:hypothetical protein